MYGAAIELDAYYAATNEAKELVEHNLWDRGMEKWERALKRVTPHISLEQLTTLKCEFSDFFQSRRIERNFSDDTDSDSSEKGGDVEGRNNEDANHSPNVDGSAMAEDYQTEHMKLMKRRYTMGPRKKTLRMPGRSSTIPNLERRETGRVPHSTHSEVNDDQFRTPRGDKEGTIGSPAETRSRESIMSSERMTVSEPSLNLAFDESSSSGSNKTDVQITPNSTQLHPCTIPGGLMGNKENDDWFSNLNSIAHNFVYGEKREFWPTQPIKVAILDSGYALAGAAAKAMKPYSDRIQEKKTFTNEFPTPKTPLANREALDDPVGHGTTVAYQLMRTCPSAHVYIAKVTVSDSDHRKAVPDKVAVARAIRHAAKPVIEGGWGVDVINMSFGWDESDLPGTADDADEVSGAIEFAEKKGVLLFAAASNYGLTQLNDVFYPARDPRVISVDAEDGLGNPARFALQSLRGAGGVRYCAPGLSVDSPVSAEPMCGSSFACPVAAGVAVLVLEFARHESVSLSESSSVKRALSSARGMLKVFGLMSQQAANHPGFKMLYPWHFLEHDYREKVALDILGQLRIEFGKASVGHEVKWNVNWEST